MPEISTLCVFYSALINRAKKHTSVTFRVNKVFLNQYNNNKNTPEPWKTLQQEEHGTICTRYYYYHKGKASNAAGLQCSIHKLSKSHIHKQLKVQGEKASCMTERIDRARYTTSVPRIKYHTCCMSAELSCFPCINWTDVYIVCNRETHNWSEQ